MKTVFELSKKTTTKIVKPIFELSKKDNDKNCKTNF